MNYDHSLPTVATAIRHLKLAREALHTYLMEIAEASEMPDAPDLLADRVHTAATAMDHINSSVKNLDSIQTAHTTQTAPHYYFSLQDGSGRIVLMENGQPVPIAIVNHSSWPGAMNVAYNVLRHQKGDDYAMVWAHTFHQQVTSKLSLPAWTLDHGQIQEWTNIHDWHSIVTPSSPPGVPSDPH